MLMSNVLSKNPLPSIQLPTGSVFVSNSHYGIELEIEHEDSREFHRAPQWNVVPEQSIMGYEAVLARPLAGNDLYEAIMKMDECFQSMGNLDNAFSERTSVHAHMNILDMTFEQLINLLCLVVMFEKVLYKYVAPHRSSNHFCWSFGDCQALIDKILKVIKVYRNPQNRGNGRRLREALNREFHIETTKYAGVNLSAIVRYGSLEFRMHEGTSQPQSIIRWCNILGSMKNYAMHPGRTPANILETKQNEGIDSIFTTVLGSYKGILTYDNVEDDILHGIRLAQDFVWAIGQVQDVDYDEEIPTRDQLPFNNFMTNHVSEDDMTTAGRERT